MYRCIQYTYNNNNNNNNVDNNTTTKAVDRLP